MSLMHLSRDQVIGGARLPVVVNPATTMSPTPRVATHCTKLMYIAEGSSTLTHADGVTEVIAGEIVAIPDGYWCAGTPQGSVRTLTVYADTAFMMQQAAWVSPLRQLLLDLKLTGSSAGTLRVLKPAPERVGSIGKLLQELASVQRSGEQEFTFMARLAEVFNALGNADARAVEHVIAGVATHDRHLDRAVFLLHEQLDRQWVIADLASEVALSPSQLTRVFRTELGTAPAEYLRRIRVEEMARLLTTTDFGVAEAALQVGWRDLSHASRAFKRHYGITPSRYFYDRHVSWIQAPVGALDPDRIR